MSGYRAPTLDQVRQALRRILKPQLRRAFFEGLENPLWLKPLIELGAFGNPPGPQTRTDGLVYDVYWPELTYLIRVAPYEPAAVVDVLLKLQDSSNSWVRRAVFTVGAAIPAEHGVRLVALLRHWGVSGFGWRSDPREMVSFAVSLLEGDQVKAGRWLANALFRPVAPEGTRKPEVGLDEYWYNTELPRIVAALGADALTVTSPWLEEYERGVGHVGDDHLDLTYMARDVISTRTEFAVAPSVEQSLIDAVRDAAVRQIASSPRAAVELLMRSGTLLYRKIAMFAAKAALESGELGDHELTELVLVARELLLDEAVLHDSCLIEYGELAQALAAVAPEALEGIGDFVARGPGADLERLRRRLLQGGDESTEEAEAGLRDYLDRWRHRWLSAVGSGALPLEGARQLAELDDRLGVIEEPLAPPIRSWSWSGPNGVLSVDEMNAMSPTELVAHLESWHATGDRFGGAPSHEGQGRDLTSLLTSSPGALDGVERLIDRLRPTYVRAAIQGWEAALKAGLTLGWSQVADTIEAVLQHPYASSFPSEGRDYDDDTDYGYAKKAAVSLLVELVKVRDQALVPAEALPRFAGLLIDDADDQQAWSDYDKSQSQGGSDPLTASLNWQWPERFRGLINLMVHGTGTSWYAAAEAAVERDLALDDRRRASRAVIGESLGRLFNADLPWLREHVTRLFGGGEEFRSDQQVALTTAVVVYGYHSALWDLLADALLAAITFDRPLAVGWGNGTDPLQRIGEWVISAIIFGHKTMDDPVVAAFFQQTSAQLRGEALGRVAWSIADASVVDDGIRDRFANLWDERIAHVREQPDDRAELSGFFWVARSDSFPSSWWLPRLAEVLELNPDLSTERFMLGNEVARAAASDPRRALKVTKAVLGKPSQRGLGAWELARHALPIVIARALQSEAEDLRAEAVQFMNELGEEGNAELEQQVRAVLDGEVSERNLEE